MYLCELNCDERHFMKLKYWFDSYIIRVIRKSACVGIYQWYILPSWTRFLWQCRDRQAWLSRQQCHVNQPGFFSNNVLTNNQDLILTISRQTLPSYLMTMPLPLNLLPPFLIVSSREPWLCPYITWGHDAAVGIVVFSWRAAEGPAGTPASELHLELLLADLVPPTSSLL